MFGLVYVVFPAVALLWIIRKYQENKWGKCLNTVKLNGKVAIVTGGNSGIGFEVAKNFAQRGAKVILACRNLASSKEAANRIKKELLSNAEVVSMYLDLASLKSIKNFVNEVKENFSEIHLLINNAGVSVPKHDRAETVDGFEANFGINYLGHFYLTCLLLDVLKNSQPSRIVIVTSLLHEKAKLNLNDLNMKHSNEKSINPYATSKLANMYFCRELAKRVEGSGVNVYAVCPGWVYTNLFRYHKIKWYHYIAATPIAFFFMRSAKQGAETIIYCATEPSLIKDNGYLYRNCKKYTSKHDFTETDSLKLWEETEHMLHEKIGSD